jgi:hypothetical protein
MLASSIRWILITAGIATAAGGFGAFVFPRLILQFVFGVKSADGVTMFLIRHWGVLIFVVGALTVYSAYVPAARSPILLAAVIEKLVGVALILFGPLKRTAGMTFVAILDGAMAILFLAFLAGQ